GYHPSLHPDYQQLGGAMLNGGAVMSSSVDYHQLGRHTQNQHPSLDWSTDYHGNGLGRDKYGFEKRPLMWIRSGPQQRNSSLVETSLVETLRRWRFSDVERPACRST
ncbi:hypothetical protein JOQ06_001735, partial [Pogonophryne albipinna]